MNEDKKINPRVGAKKDIRKLREDFYKAVEEGNLTPAEAIRSFRIMIGKTQKEYALFSDVSIFTLKNIERGKGNPTVQSLEKLLSKSGLKLTVSIDKK
jgi:DNA-binding XRE family transcriptional regulator